MSTNQLTTTVSKKKFYTLLVLFIVVFLLLCHYFFQYQLLLFKIGFIQDSFNIYKSASDQTKTRPHEEDLEGYYHHITGYYGYVERYYPSNTRFINSGEPLDEITEKGRSITLTLLRERMEKSKIQDGANDCPNSAIVQPISSASKPQISGENLETGQFAPEESVDDAIEK